MSEQERYIPALRFDALTPLFDPAVAILLPEKRFKRLLVERAGLQAGQRVLDVGCGTGTLAIMVKQAYPAVDLTGLDADEKVLTIARHKIARAGVSVTLDHGLANDMPYPDATFDRVLSSLVFHHLDVETKQAALGEIFRVLRPGGEFHLGDLGAPIGLWARLIRPLARRLEEAAANVDGLLPDMLRRAGFDLVEESGYINAPVGTLALIRAVKPA